MRGARGGRAGAALSRPVPSRHEDRGGEEHLQDPAHRRPQPCQGAGAGRERRRQAGGGRAGGAGECAGGERGAGPGRVAKSPAAVGAVPGLLRVAAAVRDAMGAGGAGLALLLLCTRVVSGSRVSRAVEPTKSRHIWCRWGLEHPFQCGGRIKPSQNLRLVWFGLVWKEPSDHLWFQARCRGQGRVPWSRLASPVQPGRDTRCAEIAAQAASINILLCFQTSVRAAGRAKRSRSSRIEFCSLWFLMSVSDKMIAESTFSDFVFLCA